MTWQWHDRQTVYVSRLTIEILTQEWPDCPLTGRRILMNSVGAITGFRWLIVDNTSEWTSLINRSVVYGTPIRITLYIIRSKRSIYGDNRIVNTSVYPKNVGDAQKTNEWYYTIYINWSPGVDEKNTNENPTPVPPANDNGETRYQSTMVTSPVYPSRWFLQ